MRAALHGRPSPLPPPEVHSVFSLLDCTAVLRVCCPLRVFKNKIKIRLLGFSRATRLATLELYAEHRDAGPLSLTPRDTRVRCAVMILSFVISISIHF